MPYIDQVRREALYEGMARADGHDPRHGCPQNAGELNYVITKFIQHYVETHGLHYETLNAVVGALEQAKDEFQRRVVHPHEDEAIDRNGDIGYNRLEGQLVR